MVGGYNIVQAIETVETGIGMYSGGHTLTAGGRPLRDVFIVRSGQLPDEKVHDEL